MKQAAENLERASKGIPKIPWLFFAMLVAAAEGVIISLVIFFSPSSGPQLVFGLSRLRLILVCIVLGISGLMVWSGLRLRSNTPSGLRRLSALRKNVDWVILATFWGALAATFGLSEQYFSFFLQLFPAIDAVPFYERIFPVLVWFILVGFQTSLGLILSFHGHFSQADPKSRPLFVNFFFRSGEIINRKQRLLTSGQFVMLWRRFRAGILVWIFLLLIWLWISVTKIGLLPDDRFWNGGGVPILPQQIIFIGIFLLISIDVKKILASRDVHFIHSRSFTRLVPVLIWISSVLLWSTQELRHTYFSPGPYPPNYVHYPFSDATRFDIGGQYFLLGSGMDNNSLTDRPFMLLYSAMLHLFGGQDYDSYIFIQVLILALIPVLIYFIGSQLHSRKAGVGMALLVIFKEINAIKTANQAGIINVKVLMSELPNALLLALLALVLILWTRKRSRQSLYAVIAGGVLALAVGVRGTSLALLPLIPLVFFFEKRVSKQPGWLVKGLAQSGIFLLAFSLVLLPYSVETTLKYGSPFWLSKINLVIERSSFNRQPLHVSETHQTYRAPKSSSLNRDFTRPASLRRVEDSTGDILPAYVLEHFVHNEITTLQIYPWDLSASPLDEYMQKPYWADWEGRIDPGEGISIAVLLLILSVGIGYSFHQKRYAALYPLLIHLTYNLANSLARTSGGRYLAPTDWVIHIYFALGILVITTTSSMNARETEILDDGQPKKWPVFLLLGLCLLLGLSYLTSGLIPDKLNLGDPGAIFNDLPSSRWEEIAEAGLTQTELDEFLGSDLTTIQVGMVLYPRLFLQDEKTPDSSYLPEMPSNEQRLYFQMLTAESAIHVTQNLRDTWVNSFPNAEFALIIGCAHPLYVQGKLFIPLNLDQDVIVENPADLACDN